ncbi:MAG: glycoside hydrolase family 15 protein, partial [Chloroflexi bacterium]|nr:glycoside hydrolase family 15 protein [Chloroflexota bacterium]
YTTGYWRNWLSKCTYRGRWREVVYRSALTLKLLTYEPTGAIVAAPTCSLPEVIGGERNWDYRYTWIRDTAFILYAFMRIGLTDEAKGFMSFLERISAHPGSEGPLNLMYTIRGEAELTESEIPNLEGYMGSSPVRVGNGAHNQLQLDIYGEVMDSVYLYNKYGAPISYDLWSSLRKMLNWVVDNWERPDEGIWEVRGGRQHFVHSKLMCWVALDRGIRLAEKRSFPSDRQRWIEARDRIYEQVMERGWNKELGSFVQYYDSETLDASSLLMSMVFFMSPQDPRMLSTIDAIEKHLTHDSLVYRYDLEKAAPDGLAGEEGTFTICTFWLVEALTRSGRLDDARYLFERMLGYANHLGLYSEQIGVSGDLLGNFPQGFTHLGLISAAFNLDRALGRRGI